MALSMNQDDSLLRRRIVRMVQHGRHSEPVFDKGLPRFSTTDTIIENGKILRRRVIILLTAGCSIPTCTMCPFTNYNLFQSEKIPSSPAEQLENDFAVTPPKDIDVVSIYNDGSFFADSEISHSHRLQIADIINESGIPHVVVESLPQFLTTDRLEQFANALEARLTIGIGLQSADDFVRQVCVGTSFTRRQFETAVDVTRDLNVVVKPYVMIKPPFLNDADALSDVKLSSAYLNEIGVGNVTLCPTRIAPNTLVDRLHKAGAFSVPHPYTVLAALHAALISLDARIALVNLTAEDFSSVTSTSAASDTARQVLKVLRAFSSTGDTADLILPEPFSSAFEEHCRVLENAAPTDLRRKTGVLLDKLDKLKQ